MREVTEPAEDYYYNQQWLEVTQTQILEVVLSTHIDGLNLAKLFKQVSEILLCGLLVHLSHPQSCAAHYREMEERQRWWVIAHYMC